ncbi:MAG: dTDP-4-dehydrorhamnose reductase, partial [Desulfonatronovibrionaceae bacterium]
GKTGLLGQALTAALDENGWSVLPLKSDDLDLFDREAVNSVLQNRGITHIFNCAAYTRVDDAEEEPAEARHLNRDLPAALGRAACDSGTALIHFSTDFVFNGKKNCPYSPEDEPDPINVYGQTKLAGEKALLKLEIPELLIIRTAWLFGPGKSNFVTKILELAPKNNPLHVVHDQIGSPTYTKDLARHTLELLENEGRGIYHVVNSGEASWCELAAEALACVGSPVKVHPVDSSAFQQKAKRPGYSVLDISRLTRTTYHKPRPWAQALRDFLYHTEV